MTKWKKLYKEKEFPNVSTIPCGQIIRHCWLSQFDSAEQVQASLQDMICNKLGVDRIARLDGLDTVQDMSIEQVMSS